MARDTTIDLKINRFEFLLDPVICFKFKSNILSEREKLFFALELSELALDNAATLLLHSHKLESVEVGKRSSFSTLSQSKGNRG